MRDVFWAEELGEEEHVVEGDGHATASQRVSHIHCVAEDEDAGGFLCGGWEERVWHAAQFTRFEGLFEGWADAGGDAVHGDSCHVILYAADFGGGRGEVLWDVDEDSSFVRADLVYEDWRGIGENDMAVVWSGDHCVDEFEGPEFRSDLWCIREDFFAEFGGVAVGDEGEGAKVVVVFAGGLGLHT